MPVLGNIKLARPILQALLKIPEIPAERSIVLRFVIDWPFKFTSVVAGLLVASSLKEGMLNWPVSRFYEKSAS